MPSGGRRVPSRAEAPAKNHGRSWEHETLAAVLGPQLPTGEASHAVWQDAAHAIADYRARYEIDPDAPEPLGPEPAADAFQQRLDRRHAAERTDAVTLGGTGHVDAAFESVLHLPDVIQQDFAFLPLHFGMRLDDWMDIGIPRRLESGNIDELLDSGLRAAILDRLAQFKAKLAAAEFSTAADEARLIATARGDRRTRSCFSGCRSRVITAAAAAVGRRARQPR
jgi:hypothetical protein